MELDPAELVRAVRAAHERERGLLVGLTGPQVRAPSTLPGWTRGHVLAARLAFLRAVDRQITYATTGRSAEFYDGDRAGREAAIEQLSALPADRLVALTLDAGLEVDQAWSGLDPEEFARPATYRGPAVLQDVCVACWREAELHAVDLDLGVRPWHWSRQFCLSLLEFLTPRVPEGTQLELRDETGGCWRLGTGTVVRIDGTLCDLAAWLAGRAPDGRLASSTGSLPPLRRLRDAQPGRTPARD